MRNTEYAIRLLIREEVARLNAATVGTGSAAIDVDETKVYQFADSYLKKALNAPLSTGQETLRLVLIRNLGTRDKFRATRQLVIGYLYSALEKVLGGASKKTAAEACVNDAFGYLGDHGDLDLNDTKVKESLVIFTSLAEQMLDILSKLPRDQIMTRPEKQGIPYNKNVEEIQKIIGTPADGKWGSNTQEAFKAWLNSKTSVTIEGASKEDIIKSWKSSAPKITRVGGKQVSFTGNASGLLSFIRAINIAKLPPPISPEVPGGGL